MDNLLLILLFIFGGVALMAVLGGRFAQPMEPHRMQRITRWIYPLVGLALVLSLARHYLQG